MHYLIGFIAAIMMLFPAFDDGGIFSIKAWMESYEKYLYQQMYDNLSAVASETQTELSEAEYEQTASEEVSEESPDTRTGGGDMVHHPSEEAHENVESVETTVQNCENPPVETEVEVAESTGETILYQVDGYIPDESLQTYLYTQLCNSGIGYFMPYAVCLIAQESTWNPMAENPNGIDKGLLQYRTSYWPTLEWWNPYAEIDIFVQQMANRAAIGCTVSDMISRHNQSDWGQYCQSYVDAVMAHAERLVQIR